jgi:hypothetical protein
MRGVFSSTEIMKVNDFFNHQSFRKDRVRTRINGSSCARVASNIKRPSLFSPSSSIALRLHSLIPVISLVLRIVPYQFVLLVTEITIPEFAPQPYCCAFEQTHLEFKNDSKVATPSRMNFNCSMVGSNLSFVNTNECSVEKVPSD